MALIGFGFGSGSGFWILCLTRLLPQDEETTERAWIPLLSFPARSANPHGRR